MDEKKLIFLAFISTFLTCGLLAPIWVILLFVYFLVKAMKTKPKPVPKIILPDNSHADEWVFEIRKVDGPFE